MRYFSILDDDPFTVFKEGDFPSYESAARELLKGIPEGANVVVVDLMELISRRGGKGMSWIDETKGG